MISSQLGVKRQGALRQKEKMLSDFTHLAPKGQPTGKATILFVKQSQILESSP